MFRPASQPLPRRGHRHPYFQLAHALVVSAVGFGSPVLAQQVDRAPPSLDSTILAGQVDLSRLVDLASQRLHLNIEYDEASLKGTVTLRLGGSVSDEELWTLVNQLLSARGFTTVRGAGGTLSVVKLADAAGLAQVGQAGEANVAGFATVAVRVQHRPVKEIVDALAAVLSKPGGKAQAVSGTSLVLISDLSIRIDQALDLLSRLDAPEAAVAMEEIPISNLSATQLATLVAQVRAKSEAVGAQPVPGDLLPSPSGSSLLVFAPRDRMAYWRDLIASLDRRQPAETRTYSPGLFTAQEVASLIEQTVHQGANSTGTSDAWRLIVEDPTRTIILTARPDQHAQVEAILERLASLPPGERRPVRSFVVRNRSVTEILSVLQELIGSGALDAAEVDLSSSPAPTSATENTVSSYVAAQRSERQVLPPGTVPTAASTPATAPATATPAQVGASGAVRPGTTALPPITLTADEGTSTIIAVGEPRLLAQVEHLIQELDVRQPQVMLEVILVSLSDGQTLDLGVELEKLEIGSDAIVRLASLFGLSRLDGAGGRTAGEARGFSGVVLDPGDFAVVVRALETINDGRSLSRPKLLVSNGQQAVFNSVREEPFISTNASDTVATTSFGGTQDAGTTVTMRPQIAEADHLVLEYSISLSTFVGESSNPALPPPRQQNQVQSVATIPDGYTVVVGGLETTSKGESVDQVPFLGSIPVLGELFKSRSKSNSRTRFFVFLRADVMRGESFESLKYTSDRAKAQAQVNDGWPEVEPLVIR